MAGAGWQRAAMTRNLLLCAAVLLSSVGCATSTSAPREAPTPVVSPAPYAPPGAPLQCPLGLSDVPYGPQCPFRTGTYALDWQVIKSDDGLSLAQVTVILDADHERSCRVHVGEVPRHCSYSEERTELTCTDADGSRPHRIRVERAADLVAVWIEAPERTFELARIEFTCFGGWRVDAAGLDSSDTPTDKIRFAPKEFSPALLRSRKSARRFVPENPPRHTGEQEWAHRPPELERGLSCRCGTS